MSAFAATGERPLDCTECEGLGFYTRWRRDPDGTEIEVRGPDCVYCGGTGIVLADPHLVDEEDIMDEESPEHLPAFDPNLSPDSQVNRLAARARGLRFDPRKRCYRDRDGALVRDQYGQPL